MSSILRMRIPAAVTFLILALSTARTALAVDYAATYQVLGAVPAFCPNEQKTISVKVTNTGALTWDTSAYHLSYHLAQGANVVLFDGVRSLLPAPVAPGTSVTLSAAVKAPAGAGTYTLQLDMVRENVTWFSWTGAPTKNVDFTVAFLVSCAQIQAPALIAATFPAIDGCLPGTRPGLFVVCWGKNFGASKGSGKILMKGLPNSGNIDLSNTSNLKWNDLSFFADVPPDLGGFRKGQTVRIQVVNASGRSSNEWTINIDPVYDVVSISNGIATACAGQHDDKCSVGKDIYGQFWHRGDHSNHGLFPNGDSGTDTWTFNLLNDWVTDHLDFNDSHPGASQETGFSAGASNLTVKVSWSYDWGTGGTWEAYDMNVWAVGPHGVPYK